jgi:hypothetical protein
MSDVSKTDNPDGSTININVDNNRISSAGLAGIICGAVAISVIIIIIIFSVLGNKSSNTLLKPKAPKAPKAITASAAPAMLPRVAKFKFRRR